MAGGGIGGLSAALALARQGFDVKVLEQASAIGEIGAGIQRWTYGGTTLLGDAAHPMLQYIAQGTCMAMEDALGEAVRVHRGDWAAAIDHYQRSRVARTARVVLSAREMGRIYHAKGVERLVRNDLWRGRTPERHFDALEWLYGWRAARCLA